MIFLCNVGGITRYRVRVTKRSNGESDIVTTNDLFIVLTHLECCQEYDFSVAAGNSDIFGDPLNNDNGFRTRPDVTSKSTCLINFAALFTIIRLYTRK